MKSYSKAQSLLEKFIVGPFNCSFQNFLFTKYVCWFFSVLHLAKSDQIAGSQSSLSPRRDENYHWLPITEFFNVVEGWFVHRCHSRTIMFFAKAFEMNFYRNGSHIGSKVEKAVFVCSKPFSNICSVGHSGWETHHPDLSLFVHSRNDDLQNSSSFLSEQVDLIKNDKPNLLSVLSILASRDSVPLFRSSDDNISFG